MKRSIPILGLVFLLLCVGVSGLFRFSDNVRTIDAVGLSGSGFSLGVAFALLVLGLVGAIKGIKGHGARSEAGKEQERQQSQAETTEGFPGPRFSLDRCRRPCDKQLAGVVKSWHGRSRGRRLVHAAAAKPVALKPEQRLLILDTWQRSGLPAADFAALVGLSKHTLYSWKKKFDADNGSQYVTWRGQAWQPVWIAGLATTDQPSAWLGPHASPAAQAQEKEGGNYQCIV